jgi:hypothetical protein
MSLVDRVAELLRAAPAYHDEQAAARALGYTRRADHPWGVPLSLNQQRAPVVETEGACGELREFGSAEDFSC